MIYDSAKKNISLEYIMDLYCVDIGSSLNCIGKHFSSDYRKGLMNNN